MSMTNTFLHELEQESATTRRFLEQIPADKLGWKPHEKSLSAGQLGMHIATIPGMVSQMASHDECPPPDFKGGFPEAGSVEEILTAHDESLARCSETIAQIGDDRMTGTWKLVVNGQELMTMPRAGFCRAILFNHLYHHRGQLGVYLRMMGAHVPSAYGPSGDEMPPEFVRVQEAMSAAM